MIHAAAPPSWMNGAWPAAQGSFARNQQHPGVGRPSTKRGQQEGRSEGHQPDCLEPEHGGHGIPPCQIRSRSWLHGSPTSCRPGHCTAVAVRPVHTAGRASSAHPDMSLMSRGRIATARLDRNTSHGRGLLNWPIVRLSHRHRGAAGRRYRTARDARSRVATTLHVSVAPRPLASTGDRSSDPPQRRTAVHSTPAMRAWRTLTAIRPYRSPERRWTPMRQS